MKLILHTYRLLTRKIFTTSHGSAAFRRCLIIELQQDGYSGYGEATEILYYGKNLEAMIQLVKINQDWMESMPLADPLIRYRDWYERFHQDRFVLCAIDTAYHDLYGKLHQTALTALWGLNRDTGPLSSLTVGIDTIDGMVEHIRQNPWPVYKIKLGTPHDMDIMHAIRACTEKPLRVDVNEGWSARQTIPFSHELKALDVEFIEQPLAANRDSEMQEVFSQVALPVFADESCHTPEDVKPCSAYFHGINIKLMKCGGLTPALEMIRQARVLGLKIMIGCMTETSIGISALGQILPLVDYADMDGSILISNDPATGVYLDQGKAVYPDIAGTGAQLMDKNPLV